jgi:tetratricopeptide (TPR) repeat protein
LGGGRDNGGERLCREFDGEVRFEEALDLLEGRRFLEAVDAFSELVALAPDMTGAYGNRGLAYLNLGLEDKARKDFLTVLQLDPDDAMGHSMLAEVARFHGTPEETLAHVAAALELSEEEPQAHFIRGWLFAKAGQYALAAEDFERFMELAKDRDNTDVEDLHFVCKSLASDNPVDDDGEPIETDEDAEYFLRSRGWSFDCSPNPDFEEQEQPCLYGHCIRNRPPLTADSPEGCPAFEYSCPGGVEQVAWCREHPPFEA